MIGPFRQCTFCLRWCRRRRWHIGGANIGDTADHSPPSCTILCRLQRLLCW